MKYTFQIEHAGEDEIVKFTIEAENPEKAEEFARLLNPSAKVVRSVSNLIFTDDGVPF